MSRPALGVRPAPVAVPPAVRALAGWSVVTPVWRNELGGLTFRLDEPGRTPRRRGRYLKWVPHGSACPDPAAEGERLRWAGRHTLVPRVLSQGSGPDGAWLVTEAIPGTSAIEPRWAGQAAHAARVIGAGLRLLHDLLPVATCPFLWSAPLRAGALPDRVRRRLPPPPPPDRLVVCHGDATVPNTLLADDGTFAAHVDVGELGVADRWADLAVTTRSVTRRYGPGLEGVVLEAYGVDPDPERTTYYRDLWDAVESWRVGISRARSAPSSRP